MAGLIVQTQPTAEPLSEAEIRNYLKSDDSADQALILMMGKTARKFCEDFTHRSLMPQTLNLFLDATEDMSNPLWEGMRTGPYLNYYKNYVTLPRGPVQAVSSLKTYNDDDVATTMASSRYYVDTAREPSRITLRTGETFPTALRVANSIEVIYLVGYTNASTVPEPLKLGMLMHIAYMFDQRGDMKDYQETLSMPPMIQKLYSPYVVHGGMGSSVLMATG